MPRRPNNITISLPQEMLNRLEDLAKEGESLGICAKRLLLSLLEESINDKVIPTDQDDRLTRLEKTVEELLNRLEDKETVVAEPPMTPDGCEEFYTESPTGENDGLTSAELAKKERVNKSTVTRWAKKGEDPHGWWRFDQESRRWFKKR